MNSSQRVVLWVGFVLILIAGLFPPWSVERVVGINPTVHWKSGETHFGFMLASHFVQPDTTTYPGGPPDNYITHWHSVETLETGKLLAEEGTLALLTIIAFFALSSQTNKHQKV